MTDTYVTWEVSLDDPHQGVQFTATLHGLGGECEVAWGHVEDEVASVALKIATVLQVHCSFVVPADPDLAQRVRQQRTFDATPIPPETYAAMAELVRRGRGA